jgi:hypothetical protein
MKAAEPAKDAAPGADKAGEKPMEKKEEAKTK